MIEIKLLKEWKTKRIGDTIRVNDKAASEWVAQGYAEYVTPSKPIKQKQPLTQLQSIIKKYSASINDIKSAILAIYSDKSNDPKMIENFSLSYESFENDDDRASYCSLRLKKDYDVIMSADEIKKLAKQLPDAVKNKEKEDFAEQIVKKVEQKERTDSFKEKSKKQDKEDDYIRTSFLEHDGQIYEQIQGGKFLTIKDGEVKIFDILNIDGERFKTHIGEELEKGREVVLLPSGIEDYGTVVDLVKEIKEFIHKYVDVAEQFETFASYYVLLSYVYDRVPTINYLSVMGDLGTGKSRVMDTIGRLLYKFTMGSGAVSPAGLKRIVNKYHGSCGIDEGDFKLSDETQDIIKFLNLGFEKNRPMYNCNKNDPEKLEFFDPYCPKLISRRRDFEDKATESRCITEVMRVTNRKDIPELLTEGFYKKQDELRNKLLKFRFDYFYKINLDEAMKIDLGELEPRIKQAVRGFTVLFYNVPEVLYPFKQFIAKYQVNVIEERSESYDGLIINCIVDLIVSDNLNITSADISEKMKERSIDPKYASTRTIGRHLKQLGLETVPKKVNGKAARIIPIFENERFIDVVKRYCSDSDKVTLVTKVTLHMSTQQQRNLTANFDKLQKTVEDQCNVTNVTNVTEKSPEDQLIIAVKGLKGSDGYSDTQKVYDRLKVEGVTNPDELIKKGLVEGWIYEAEPAKLGVM